MNRPRGTVTPIFGYIWAMTAGILFTIAIFLLLLRIFYLRVKANAAKTESFKRLAPKDKP